MSVLKIYHSWYSILGIPHSAKWCLKCLKYQDFRLQRWHSYDKPQHTDLTISLYDFLKKQKLENGHCAKKQKDSSQIWALSISDYIHVVHLTLGVNILHLPGVRAQYLISQFSYITVLLTVSQKKVDNSLNSVVNDCEICLVNSASVPLISSILTTVFMVSTSVHKQWSKKGITS